MEPRPPSRPQSRSRSRPSSGTKPSQSATGSESIQNGASSSAPQFPFPPPTQTSAPLPPPPPTPKSMQSSTAQPPPLPPPLPAPLPTSNSTGGFQFGNKPGLASPAEGIFQSSKTSGDAQNSVEALTNSVPPEPPSKSEVGAKIYRPEENMPAKTPAKKKIHIQKSNLQSGAVERLNEESLSKDMKAFMLESTNLIKTVDNLEKAQVQRSDVNAHKVLIRHDELLRQKRKLKTVNKKSRFYPVKLGRRELLKDYDWNMDYLPIPVVLESVRNAALTADLVSLDFTGIEQLTDYLFYILKITKSLFPSMQKFVATGCVHLSDQGLTWASELFPKLSSVEVQGCIGITEKGVHMLAKNCPDLHKLTLTATNVGRLPSKLAEAKVSTITCEGCPIISASAKFNMTAVNALKTNEDSGIYEELPSFKIVILRDTDIDVSITSLFVGSDNQKPSPALMYTKDWLPDPRMKLEGKFNMMEVPADSPLIDSVISPGCMVVIAFAPTGQADLYSKLATRVTSVLSKCRDTMVTLMAVHGDKSQISIDDVLIRVKEKLGYWQTAMHDQFFDQTKRFWRLECVDFVSQISLSAGAADVEVLDEILDKDLIAVLSVSRTSPDRMEISNFVYKALKSMHSRFRWLYNQYRKETLEVMTEIRPRTYWNLERVFNNFADDAKKILNPRNSFQHVGKLLELMKTMGTVLYYPSLKDSPCLTDLPHLEKVLQSLYSAPQKVHIKCLGPETPCWGEDQLQIHLQSSQIMLNQIQAEGLRQLLVKLGFLLPFPNPENSSQLYILASQLPTHPAVELTHLWPDINQKDEALHAEKFYTFLLGIPTSLFSQFIRKCMKLFPPQLVWKSGLLFQQGPVSVLVELTANTGTDLDGSPVLVVIARLPCLQMSSLSSKKVSRQCLFSTLNTVCHIIDYLLRKYNVCAFVTTPCLSCMIGKTHKTALQRQDVYHFDVASILAGHDRGIICKYEREQRDAKIRADKLLMLGEDIPSIVPFHNYSYLSAINPMVETGDPGEDQADEEGAPRKKVTVSPRISRCCVCVTGQDHLCHHCGMCRTCISNLAKVENYVKPSFVTPNLVAMQDITTTKDGEERQFLTRDHITTGVAGCVMWPNKGMEYHILQPMTSTYFNTFIIRPIRGANLYLRIKIKGFERPLEYAVLSGAVANVDCEVDQDDDWKCRDGYTVSFRLMDAQEPGMLDFVFYLNEQQIWKKAFKCSEAFITVRSEVTGCVVLHAPGIKRRQGPQYEPGMQVGIVSKNKHVSSLQGIRIGEIAVPDVGSIGLLRLVPVHTPVTEFLVKIQTGDKEDCGTSANVYIQLFGERTVSDKILLKNTSDTLFQRSSEDEFKIQTPNIGDIRSIKLSHDGMKMEDSWYVNSIIINTPILEYTTNFTCNCWLSAHLEDKQVERVLHPHSSQMKGSLQERFSPLSDKLRPLTLQEWKTITGNKAKDGEILPVLAPSWLFCETQVKSDYRTSVPATMSNVNDFIMPCTDVPLPSVVWCKMMKMRDKLERTLFQYASIDFSGSASVLLPQQVTEKEADWPSPRLFTEPTNMHPLCYVRGDMNTVVTLRPTYTLPDYMRSFWTAHIVSSPGFPYTLDNDQLNALPVLWAWHFVLALNKQFELPDYKEVFPNSNILPSAEKVTSLIETFLTQMCYRLFLLLDPSFSMEYFSESNEDQAEEAVGMVRYPLLDSFDKSGLLKKLTLFGEDEIYLCSSHFHAWQTSKDISEVPVTLISDYAPYMFTLHLQGNKLTSIPKELFSQLPHLKDLDISTNELEELPEEIGLCTKMLNLSLGRNSLVSLPDSLENMTELNRLDISNNRFIEVPPCVTKLTKIVCLYMRTMQLRSLPDDIGNMTLLEKLYLNENCIHSLPSSFKKLTNLKELAMNGVSWVKIKANTILSKRNFENTLRAANLQHWLYSNEQDKSAIFKYFDENTNGTLEPKEIGKLNATIFYTFPRFGYMGTEPPDDDTPHGFPEEILHLENLEYLSLQYHGLVGVPDDIDRLKKLKVLNLSHNPYLLSIPAQTGNLPLKRLELEECPLLKTPPKEIRAKGFMTTYAYLKRLLSGSVDCQRTKLMMVGLGGAGKTSLVKALLSGSHKTKLTVGEDITDGIDICPWTVTTDEGQVTYSVWDFAGQTVYYNTHQFFLSDRAIYMLLWNIRLGHEHAGLDFWLSSISVHAPKAPIFVVGTHVDQVSKLELPVKAMQSRYPQIAGFHFVSSHSGQGVKHLQDSLLEVTLQQSYMGEKIPGVWLSFEEQIKSLKDNSVIEYKELEKKANLSGIFSQTEVYQAVQFLHELGSLQYFTNEYLKSYVVVNPQWIVDVMSCVVSVKDSHIKDGRLKHADIPKVWKDYPENLHSWMIRLTEEFDLTFPLADEEVNLVPCLLPEREPEFNWPELDKSGSIRETKMVYKFDYLPAGLFNRGQVRLHQFSDSAMIWKRGSFLRKNKHICLIQQTRESEMLVLAQGPRPENIVFLVHEVFETLIAESFQGVTYDYLLPCPDCLKLLLKDPHMFAASTIRRATELRAPFLQCLKYFHTISIVELQGMMPPDSNTDYDIHLVQAVQGLKELSRDLVADIFVSYCSQNAPEDRSNNIFIHPSLVCKDLETSGFRCWYREDTNKYTTDEMAKALMDSEVVLVFISNDYVKDEGCCNLFKYARLTLRKPIILVVVGSGMEWKSSRLGILLADEVFVSMLQPDRYKNKFDDLMKVLQVRVKKDAADNQEHLPCFISYCWKNSAQAVDRGTKTTEGAVGFGDPRAIKQHLDDNGIPCWLDVERVGLHGLFEDIAEGLLHAKVVIVCVSDEYAASPNCTMEFRYAANTLKLPVVLAVVGTGNNWRASEIGVLTLSYPMVSFQENNHNAFDKLLNIVKHILPDPSTYSPASIKEKKDKINEEQKDLSYQELCELAQRKFLRQIVQYADEQAVEAPYPRLFLVDYVKEETPSELEEKTGTPRAESQAQGHRDIFKHPMCVHILCEHEEGWHSCSEPLPLAFDVTTLEACVPYIARITAIARFSKRLVLNCLGTTTGREFIKWVEEVVDCSDFRQIYHDLRQEVIQADPDRIMGNLARCHLPNGKTVWLCEEHRDKMRVTVLSDEVTVISHASGDVGGVDYMLQALKELDYQKVPQAIRKMAVEKVTRPVSSQDKEGTDVTEEHTKKSKVNPGETSEETPEERTASASSQESQKSNPSILQSQGSQQAVSAAQRSMKTRKNAGRPQLGNRTKSRACSVM